MIGREYMRRSKGDLNLEICIFILINIYCMSRIHEWILMYEQKSSIEPYFIHVNMTSHILSKR